MRIWRLVESVALSSLPASSSIVANCSFVARTISELLALSTRTVGGWSVLASSLNTASMLVASSDASAFSSEMRRTARVVSPPRVAGSASSSLTTCSATSSTDTGPLTTIALSRRSAATRMPASPDGAPWPFCVRY